MQVGWLCYLHKPDATRSGEGFCAELRVSFDACDVWDLGGAGFGCRTE